MDRQYTLFYFGKSVPQSEERQFALFIEVMEVYRVFAATHDLSMRRTDDAHWNLNIPKICDNIVIGHRLLMDAGGTD